MKKHITTLVLSFSMICTYSFGQDIHFSQFNLTPLLVNPAQAGAYKDVQGIINFKNQWASISPDAFKTVMFSADGRLMKKKWGNNKWLSAGLTLASDKVGEAGMKTFQTNIFVGYHVSLDEKNILGAALTGGFVQRSIDYTQLTWEEQYVNGAYNSSITANESTADNKFGYADFGLGILHQFNKGEAYATDNDMLIIHSGLAISHLNKPDYSFLGNSEKLYSKISGHIDALIGIKNTNFAVVPGFLFMKQGPASEVLPGSYFRYRFKNSSASASESKGISLMIGTHFRVKDAFIPSVQFEYNEYTLGMSYDMNVSGLKSISSGKGGFEISLRYGMNSGAVRSAASFN